MHFKTLEIQGFKSFPEKTTLTFDSRMTAVVGSNGNGKSNISDALRWVMGEQGAKSLRGDKMEDVIFYGTQTRKAMGFAKVALTIDNTDRRLPIDADEVVIERKLYRSGESEYIINGEKSRLKDIGSLFMGTGLGRDGYSIIGQGRIDEIVNSKPSGRRELFEEAAGVSKFLHQKAQAERELSRTQENLLRLLDIETELQARIPVLERQSEKAKKAFELKQEEQKVGVALCVRELERIEKDIEQADNSMLQNQGECEHFDRETEELELELNTVSDKKRELAAQSDALNRQGEAIRAEIAESDKAIAVMQTEIQLGNERVTEIREQIAVSEKSNDEHAQKLHELEQQITELQKFLEDADAKTAELNESVGLSETSVAQLDGEHKDTVRMIGELYTAKSAAGIYISRANENIADLTEQIAQMQSAIDGQDGEKAKLLALETELKSKLGDLIEERDETSNKLSGYSRLYETKTAKRDEAAAKLDEIRREHQQKKTRFDILSDVERSMEGYYPAVRAVMNAAKTNRFGSGEVLGTVADIITVDKQHATAIEVALGSALQNVVVANETTAKRCIAFLKETRGGRATFLPLTSVKGNALSNPRLYAEDGFVGLGYEIVAYDENRFDGIVKKLLGHTVVMEDIDSATVVAKKYSYSFKIVTLDGQVINAGGSFTGGSLKKSEGIIGRKQEVSDLAAHLEKLSQQIEPAKTLHAQLAAECAKMKLECEGFRESLSDISDKEIQLTAELKGARNMLSMFDSEQVEKQKSLESAKSRLTAEQSVVAENQEKLNSVTAKLEEMEQLAAEKSGALEELIAKRREVEQAISDLNMEQLTKSKDIEKLTEQIAALNKQRVEASENREQLNREIVRYGEKNAELETAIAKKQEQIAEKQLVLQADKGKSDELAEEIAKCEKRNEAIHNEIREKTAHKEKFTSAYAAAAERKSGLITKAEEVKATLFDDYELTRSEAIELVALDGETALDLREAKLQLAEIKRKLAALGNVNFAAIEEFNEVSERYAVLSKQLADVRKGKSELEKLINELTLDIRERFLEAFNDISGHFTRIFGDIFGGGSASLKLVDNNTGDEPVDLLTAGIEIFAAPPGKLAKSLTLLSGGEKALVAITLYFALLMHRPSPFCMLDEVDAALDEVNVVKYVNYLKRYSATTQLMTITHRRSTIEGCDVLYGVYMQEKGVSQLLKQVIT